MKDLGFKYSSEQKKIVDFVSKKTGNAYVEAYAGTGKSTVLIACAIEIAKCHPGKKIQMICHNIDAAKNLREKLAEVGLYDENSPITVAVNTYHSIGYRMLIENKELLNLTELQIDDEKYDKYIEKNINEISEGVYDSLKRNQKSIYRRNLSILTGYCRHYLAKSTGDIMDVASLFGMQTILNEYEAIKKILDWGKTNLDYIDYQDMLWLPNVLNLNTKWHLSDYVFVDEAQDTSKAQYGIFTKIMQKRGCRYVSVGDGKQMINRWCGSSEIVYELFKKPKFFSPAKYFTLTECRRCCKNVIKLAQEIVPEINYLKNKQDGIVRFNGDLIGIKNGDLVLCRNSAPLAKLYLELTNLGHKVKLLGDNKTEMMHHMLDDIDASNLAELVFKVESKLIDTWYILSAKSGADLKDIASSETIRNMLDDVKTVLSFTRYCKTLEELKSLIDSVYYDNTESDENVIRLSTIHKAKGLEADRVFILYPSLVPSSFATLDWEIKAEENLKYVMITRAINELVYLKEDDESYKNIYTSNIGIYNELKRIEKNLNLYK